MVEARGSEEQAEALLRTLLPCTGAARVIGLTGPPGSGKSTLADVLARRYRAAAGGRPGADAGGVDAGETTIVTGS